MYSKHFDSKEFLLQIMILFEAETEQLLKFKQTNIKWENKTCVLYNTFTRTGQVTCSSSTSVFIATIKYAGCNLAM